ncbi:transcriptional regulator [Lacticaseibacillus chiayiensis]|uniref:Helix-turn-helix domain-containing protein n=1 Tax=Lacticaseibacillus chiayiensis TaxID=2100821 RepID=A0A4Q1THW6_9LACO|nr:helix-turn-helix transcriptional regulator [Lacticaseibacillus chiayiensis]QVI34876.1 helix-turn-helix transcriptional regulator [Lacticaseibacillus chiayiensis]RXT18009.1 transcriptional regulator [Lacticaseibacillus chiayiensis]UYN56634.1 helix-turn-helix domain-containing protein [Lacticaseibacillus chiayiensis]
MEINVGAVISKYRKQKGITQQALADFIGISKASVSKWETGQSYPDITLLPILAAYFDVSIDKLMAYNAQLSAAEIRRVYTSMKHAFETQPAETVLTSIHNLIRRYYACYPFLLQMGLLLLNHYDLLPGDSLETKKKTYVTEALQLFVRVRQSGRDLQLTAKAVELEGYSLLLLNRPDDVLALLGEYVPEQLPADSLIAGAFQQKGDLQRAIATSQSGLMQDLSLIMSQLTNYMTLLGKDPERLKTTYQRGQAIAEAFDLVNLNPAVWANFQLAALKGFAQQHQTESVTTTLQLFVRVMATTKFTWELHGDRYFDAIEPWLNQLDLGPQTPRVTGHVKQTLIEFVLNNPALKELRKEQPIEQLLKELEQIKARE